MVVTPETKCRNCFSMGLKMEPVNQTLTNTTFFYQHSQPLWDDMKKQVESLEFVEGVNLEFMHLLRNHCYKALVLF